MGEEQMNLRTLGRIVIATLAVVCFLTALIYALESPDAQHVYKSLRSISYAIMALTFVTAYRYFEI
jgi:hypothetical protein